MFKRKRIIIVVGGLTALAACIYILYIVGLFVLTLGALAYDTYDELAHWREKTSPLAVEVVEDMCEKFALPEEDPRCQPGAVVYAPEFFRTIGKTFQPENRAWATFEQVEEKLGAYNYEKEPVTTLGDGTQYFRCWYDLNGDRLYPIVIDFNADGSIRRMIADVTD